ncbi:probable CoA ligase CCL8 isoform X2 [Rhododendron vialii]|uniref:probable CoA ligase CCL8 isoform X2 n=1 Tax=Rhododendron vialii TaxID=182163 RepID=UPI00266030FD|nr:probable CoA ligase CCL8 isoform X2 [Rhododendron vialii]
MRLIKAINNLRPFSSCRLLSPLHLSTFASVSSSLSLFCPIFFFSRRFSSLDHRTFMEVVKAVARQGSASFEKVAIRADQKSYTYAQLISSTLKISRLLCSANVKTVDGTKDKDRLGGARIGIVAKPSVEFVAGMLGTWFSGGVAVPLALSYPEAELLHVMNDSDVSMILSTEDHSELMKNVAAKSAAQFSLIPPVPCITEHDNSESAESDVGNSLEGVDNSYNKQGEDPALIIYTSGTTGKPKGVVHTHQGILAQVQILADAWEYTSDDQFLHCLPLHHVHGLFNALLAPLYAGSAVDFIPKFSVRGIWQRWRESYPKDGKKAEDAITVFTGVPTMYTRLIQGYEAMDPELQQASASAASKLRLMMCGSSALPYPVMQQWETITGHRLLERYGMTEFVMAISNPLNGIRKGGTVGKPLLGVQAKILPEDESGDDTTGVGELCIKSPSLFKEYWKLPEVTKESFIDGGFFKTGDAVKVDDDGYYVILGRTSADIMKVGGYKLSALEIESVLLEHPAVSECCVLGLPDKTYGEAVSAIIVPEAELKKNRAEELKPAIGLEELCTWAKERLAPYKLPTRLFLWETLPRNAMGKVNKKELKKNLAAEG